MTFGIEHFRDLLRLLDERPEWRAELRRVVLTDELLALPEQIARLRQETEQRFQALATGLEALTARLDTLTARLDTLTAQVDALTVQVATLAGHVGALRGESLEQRYRTRAFAYFAPVVRQPHALTPDEITALLEQAIDSAVLSRDEAHQLALADILLRGRSREDGSTLYLVVEVSVGAGLDDVARARDRAMLLARSGVRALPVVAGQWVTPEAAEAARAFGVWQVTDGHVVAPGVSPGA